MAAFVVGAIGVICLVIDGVVAKKGWDAQDKATEDLKHIGKTKEYYSDETFFINNSTDWPKAFRYY